MRRISNYVIKFLFEHESFEYPGVYCHLFGGWGQLQSVCKVAERIFARPDHVWPFFPQFCPKHPQTFLGKRQRKTGRAVSFHEEAGSAVENHERPLIFFLLHPQRRTFLLPGKIPDWVLHRTTLLRGRPDLQQQGKPEGSQEYSFDCDAELFEFPYRRY